MKRKMAPLYQAAGLTKQAFHQYLDRKLEQRNECEQLLPLIAEIRKEYPALSAREMYRIIQPVRMGRDRFEKYCFDFQRPGALSFFSSWSIYKSICK